MLQDEPEEYVFEMKPQQEVQVDEIEEDDEDQYTFEVKETPVEASNSEDESSSDEDIDPEEDAPITIEIKDKPVVAEPVIELVEEPIEIIDEFTYEELPEGVEVVEEALIPEDRVIENDDIQSKDMLNEMIKMADESGINNTKKILKNFNYLKKNHSLVDGDGNIVAPALKGDSYKPYSRIFQSKMYTPVVNEEKVNFKHIVLGDDIVESEDESGLSTFGYIGDTVKLTRKYKTGEGRFNYSLKNHLAEKFRMLDGYAPSGPGYDTTLNKDTLVYSNTFDDSIPFETSGGKIPDINIHRLTGPILSVPGESIKIGGIINKGTNDAPIEKRELKPKYEIGDYVYVRGTDIEGPIEDFTEEMGVVLDGKAYKMGIITKLGKGEAPTAYLFTDTDNFSLDEYLDMILPSTRDLSIVDDSANNMSYLRNYVDSYNLDLSDFTYSNLESIIKKINKNSAALEVLNVDYGKFKKTEAPRNNIPIISNRGLDELIEFYGKYPFYGSSIDTQSKRLEFILSQADSGMLFFKLMVLRIEEKMISSVDKRKQITAKKLSDLESQMNNIQESKNRYIEKNAVCIKQRITNAYYNTKDLESANGHRIEIDNDRMIHGDRQRHTKENNLGLLINPDGKNTLYVRDNKNVWIKKDKLLENELKSDKDFCDANNVSIGSLALAGKDSGNLMICKYDEKTDICVAQGFLELEKEARHLSTSIELLREGVSKLENAGNILNGKKNEIDKLKANLELEFSRKMRMERYFSKLYLEDKQESEDSNQEFYEKVDKYLESIAGLPQNDYYLGLKVLFDKYGRKAFEEENELNIYSRIGKKVLGCSHNKLFIDYIEYLKKELEVEKERRNIKADRLFMYNEKLDTNEKLKNLCIQED